MDVADWAVEAEFEVLEIACWPVSGGVKRKYAGTAHIDVAGLSAAQAGEIKAEIAEKGLDISGLGFYPNPLHPDLEVGVSPRGSLALDKVSRAHAWLQGRDQVTPDDIRAVINDCLRHRIVPSFEAQADGVTSDDVIGMVVKLVAVV
mgnify:CR=1 FL=1